MEIVIGPEVGISYQTEKSSSVSVYPPPHPTLQLSTFVLWIKYTHKWQKDMNHSITQYHRPQYRWWYFCFQPVHMADFSQVKSIQTTSQDGRGILQIRIAGAVDPLTITSSPSEVEDMADLIDGYCRLVHDINTSLWTRKGEPANRSPVCLCR